MAIKNQQTIKHPQNDGDEGNDTPASRSMSDLTNGLKSAATQGLKTMSKARVPNLRNRSVSLPVLDKPKRRRRS
jgi:hypothetical protein